MRHPLTSSPKASIVCVVNVENFPLGLQVEGVKKAGVNAIHINELLLTVKDGDNYICRRTIPRK